MDSWRDGHEGRKKIAACQREMRCLLWDGPNGGDPCAWRLSSLNASLIGAHDLLARVASDGYGDPAARWVSLIAIAHGANTLHISYTDAYAQAERVDEAGRVLLIGHPHRQRTNDCPSAGSEGGD
jgi:hypothetical protein